MQMARMSLLCGGGGGGGGGAWGVLNLIETITLCSLNISFSAQPKFLNAQR